jgi:hypothetical protein
MKITKVIRGKRESEFEREVISSDEEFFSYIDLTPIRKNVFIEVDFTIPTPFGESPAEARFEETDESIKKRGAYTLRSSLCLCYGDSLQEMLDMFQQAYFEEVAKSAKDGMEYMKFLDTLKRNQCQAEIVDLNEFSEDGGFMLGSVEVVLPLHDDVPSVAYQTSTTLDIGEMSHELSVNEESGAVDNLEEALRKYGFDEDFIDRYLYDVAEDLKKRFRVQEAYDEYVSRFGHWKPSQRGIDPNSEIFILDK